MEIHTYWAWESPVRIGGPAVVIDAYAATTNIVTFLAGGAGLFLTDEGTVEKALKKYPGAVVAGESLGAVGFSFGLPNAPAEIADARLSSMTVLYMSINGTKVIKAAIGKGAGPVIACAFTNVSAVSGYLKRLGKSPVTVLLSGDEEFKVLEDRLCADVLESEFYGEPYDWDEIHKAVARTLGEYYGLSSESPNTHVVLDRNKFSIVPVSRMEQDELISVSDSLKPQFSIG